jgi:hypothetical protein
MPLLLAESTIPPFMWAVVRLLAAEGKPILAERAQALLCPPSLAEGENKAFRQAMRGLVDLKMAAESDGRIALDGHARDINHEDFASFSAALRHSVLDRDLNAGLTDESAQPGPVDLTRTLTVFLSMDPLGPPVTWDVIQVGQSTALSPEANSASRNDTRWNRFAHWAPALGLAAPPLLPSSGQGPLTPDCTMAVKQTVHHLWSIGQRINAVEAVQALRTALPVLPGGHYANALGIADPGSQSAGPALSFALLRGEDEGWLTMQQDADAQRILTLHDPDRPSHYVSDIVISKDPHG